MAVILRYFTEFVKHMRSNTSRRSVAEFMHESIVFCSTCTMSSYRKFTFAISSPDEFLVSISDVSIVIIENHFTVLDVDTQLATSG